MPRIIVASDIHYSTQRSSIVKRRSDLAEHLFLKLVKRINRFMDADLLILCGDLLDNAHRPQDLECVKSILDQLDIPYIAIPGNHDPESFYDAIPNPGSRVDVEGVRIEIFHDQEVEGFQYVRSDKDLDRMRSVRSDGFTGPVISLQHMAFVPPGSTASPYNLTNASAAMDAMEQGAITLSIGGHSHIATELIPHGVSSYLSAAALCESPHAYHVIDINDDGVQAATETLAMPYRLVDQHNHTQYAYCSTNMRMETSIELAKTLGLDGIVFTEHSDHLYTKGGIKNKAELIRRDVNQIPPDETRMEDYLREAFDLRDDFLHVGLEIDADFKGNLFVQPGHMAPLDLKVGAVHAMQTPISERTKFVEEFKMITGNLCAQGIHILAHPFRIFRRSHVEVDRNLYPWLADVLKENNVAVEVNYHTNDPDPAFLTACVERGVRVSFGSDAHDLYEIGEFYPHLQLMEKIGVHGDPSGYMFNSFA